MLIVLWKLLASRHIFPFDIFEYLKFLMIQWLQQEKKAIQNRVTFACVEMYCPSLLNHKFSLIIQIIWTLLSVFTLVFFDFQNCLMIWNIYIQQNVKPEEISKWTNAFYRTVAPHISWCFHVLQLRNIFIIQ